jgi:hypothetical protein
MKRISFALLLLFFAVPLFAQEPIHHLEPQVTKQLQTKLSNFQCPEGASEKACQSFRELVEAGDTSLLVPFAATIASNDKAISAVYTVFDDSVDGFQVTSLFGYNGKDGLKMDVFYARYHHGFVQTATIQTFDFDPKRVLHLSQDGVDVQVNGDTLTMEEKFTNSERHNVTISSTVKLSTLRTVSSWQLDNKPALTVYGRAFKVSNE